MKADIKALAKRDEQQYLQHLAEQQKRLSSNRLYQLYLERNPQFAAEETPVRDKEAACYGMKCLSDFYCRNVHLEKDKHNQDNKDKDRDYMAFKVCKEKQEAIQFQQNGQRNRTYCAEKDAGRKFSDEPLVPCAPLTREYAHPEYTNLVKQKLRNALRPDREWLRLKYLLGTLQSDSRKEQLADLAFRFTEEKSREQLPPPLLCKEQDSKLCSSSCAKKTSGFFRRTSRCVPKPYKEQRKLAMTMLQKHAKKICKNNNSMFCQDMNKMNARIKRVKKQRTIPFSEAMWRSLRED